MFVDKIEPNQIFKIIRGCDKLKFDFKISLTVAESKELVRDIKTFDDAQKLIAELEEGTGERL